MSHSFSLNGITNLNYSDTIQALDIKDVTLQESSLLNNDGLWPQGYTHIYIDNVSARPIELEYNDDSLNIRILSSSSPEDYSLATKLTNLIATQYKSDVMPEDSDVIKYHDFLQTYNEEWCIKHSYQMIDMLFSMIKSDRSDLRISTSTGEYTAGPKLLSQLEKYDNMHDEFIKRITLFNYAEQKDIFVPSLIVLHNDEKTKQVKIATLGEGVPSLISMNANAVALSSDDHEKVIISTSQLLDILENDFDWISEDSFYVKGYSESEWEVMLKKAKAFHLEDLFSVGTELSDKDIADSVNSDKPISSFQELVSADEWQKLTYSPFLAFMLVAAADGSIDKKEIKSFIKTLSTQENPLMLELLGSCGEAPDKIISHLASLGSDAPLLLQEITEVLDSKLPEKHALAFKLELLHIGKNVAEASGGFFGFGKKASKEEKLALALIAKVFGLI